MEDKAPILIFECANAHGGDSGLLKKTIDKFKNISYSNKHIKFQPFSPDTIALKDFSWYSVYEKIVFGPSVWDDMIDFAFESYDGVWLDLFDTFGIQVLRKNIKKIYGVKVQASVLENQEVFQALLSMKLSDKIVMLNVSGHEITAIQKFIDNFYLLHCKELIIQIGYQDFPTKLEDSGLQKIHILKAIFPHLRCCIADHMAAEKNYAEVIPLMGLAAGCSLVEKHICLNRSNAEYDFYSSFEFTQMQELADSIVKCSKAMEGNFILPPEMNYLIKSIQIPVTNKKILSGGLISSSDVIYRRTDQDGINFCDILKIQSEKKILSKNIAEKTTLHVDDFKKAKVGVIVACRMKSTRLKKKATLLINGKSSLERCLDNCLKIADADTVILATSTLEEDAALEQYILEGKVKFWKGAPDDVIQRYLGACEEFNIDVVIRVTADCPLVSSEIAKVLLSHHFKTGADYTAAKDSSVGTACEIYNTEALKRVIGHLGPAKYSEYMTWYLQNNKDFFKVEIVDLPRDLIRNYRLTLDHQEDLDLLNKVYSILQTGNKEPSLKNVFKILDEDKSLAQLNEHITLKYKTDRKLIDKLNRVTKISKDYVNE